LSFIGIDHGTTAIRFALIQENRVLTFELERARAADMSENEILKHIEDKLTLLNPEELEEFYISIDTIQNVVTKFLSIKN